MSSKSTSTPRKSAQSKRPEAGKSSQAARREGEAAAPEASEPGKSGKGSRGKKAPEGAAAPIPAEPAPGADPSQPAPGQPGGPPLPYSGVPFGEAPVPPRARGKGAPSFPMSTSARMAEAARNAVWSISSEKTTGQFEAAEERARELEEERQEGMAGARETIAPPEDQRRGAKDLYSFFRNELQRPEREDDPHAAWRQITGRQRHELNPGIPPAELAQIEERLGVALPPSYWDFSLEWKGGQLYVRELDYTRIISAPEILDEVKRALCDSMLRPYLPIVDLSCGDYLALDTSRAKGEEYPVVWWSCGDPRKKVAESFAGWLRRYVEADGDPYWWA